MPVGLRFCNEPKDLFPLIADPDGKIMACCTKILFDRETRREGLTETY